jgi:type II secretory pathway component PulC
VAGVDKGGIAYQVGLQVGDIIRQINDRQVSDVGDYEKLMKEVKNQDRLILLIERDGALYFVTW